MNNNKNKNKNNNDELLERIALLESAVQTLSKEVRKKDRPRITYSPSTKKIKDIHSESRSTQDISVDDAEQMDSNLTDSMEAEDVFMDSPPRSYMDSPSNGYSGMTTSNHFDETASSEVYDEQNEHEMKFAEMAAQASEEVHSMNSEARRSRSFRYNSFMTKRMYADDDYKVNIIRKIFLF